MEADERSHPLASAPSHAFLNRLGRPNVCPACNALLTATRIDADTLQASCSTCGLAWLIARERWTHRND